ncbi:carbohydrate kinase family protein [Calidifontibacter sp. DB0510]|uniref:Carbohydrate kinase family protein n=1 Tax=Metallococcus carri TaxID=1656884 RepID=A0A967AZL7_9MICO|nr:PfkB family carbohydrate kinase [Metallococcus carri]NHN54673.1 carbohydrate kinase family protein [Metallococcus carri]NOP37018.1 carbohydrate kinase family protein [Calidifontibacter sp. DB2511S]
MSQQSPSEPECQPYDPLAADRAAGGPELDLFVEGQVFLDIIFTGLRALPQRGQEIWSEGMGSTPGGIANLAVAASRLGLRTGLAAAFGDDAYGDFCWTTLAENEHVDLSRSRRFADWHTAVTISMADGVDRAMVTHGHPAPIPVTEMIGRPPTAAAVMVDLAPGEDVVGTADEPSWVERARRDGSLVFADVGFDPSGQWDERLLDQLQTCHAFMPNALEAMAYTRTSSAHEALYALADRVPLAVVTDGVNGALALDSSTGEEATVPALRVQALDPTGAGDVFGAAVVLGTLAHWPLQDRLAFASLCSALAVQQFGGSLAAPGWGDIADWWHRQTTATSGSAYDKALRRRFGFLDALVPQVPQGATRRAHATLAHYNDLFKEHP